MIATAWFEGFKLLRNVSLDLDRLNVIVGRNGVGKSSVLDGIHYLLQMASPKVGRDPQSNANPAQRVFSGQRAPDLLVAKPAGDSFGLGVVDSEGTDFSVRVGIAGSRPRYEATFRRETIDSSVPRLSWNQFLQDATKAGLGSVLRLRLDARALAEDHYSETDHPRMEFDGEGLASVLQYLQGLRDGTLETIEADLSKVVPNAKRIRALPAKINRPERVRISVDGQDSWHDQIKARTGSRFEVEFEGLDWIRSDQLSEGTLLALGIVTALRHHAPRLVLLDDMDRGLHPVAQLELVRLLRAVPADDEDLQIIATSHSPFVLDAIEASETFVASSVDSMSTDVARLDSHPEWEKRSRFMHPGEFWSAVGEGWVAEPRP